MLAEHLRSREQLESLVGRSALEVIKEIVRRNSKISRMGIVGPSGYSSLHPPTPVWLEREGIILDKSIEQLAELKTEEIFLYAHLGFSLMSKVKLHSGQDGFIPMVDFECQPSRLGVLNIEPIIWIREHLEYLQKVKERIREMGQQEGVIIDSGNSLHYWGLRIMDFEGRNEFYDQLDLFKIQLEGGLVTIESDHGWLYHHGAPDRACLRFNADQRHPHDPLVIDVL